MNKLQSWLITFVLTASALAYVGTDVYVKLRPPAPVQPAVADTISPASKAYLYAQPAALKAAAAEIRKGSKLSAGEIIKNALLPPAQGLEAALKAQPNLPDALDKAAGAMESHLK